MKVEVKKRMQALQAQLTRIKRVVGVTLMILMLGISACSNSDDESEENRGLKIRSERQEKRLESEKIEKMDDPVVPHGIIKSVSLVSTSSADGTAMNIQVDTNTPLSATQHFIYVYWKNNQPAVEIKEPVIPATQYKKDDLLVAEVQLFDGEQLLEKKRSDQTVVPNTAPLIKTVRMPDFDGPAVYSMITVASDADDDPLTFSLSPSNADETLPEGLAIDDKTGEITYSLTGTTLPKEVVQFIVNADDGDGGTAQKLVTINFALEKTTKQEKMAEKKEEN